MMRNRMKFLMVAALVMGGTVFYYQQNSMSSGADLNDIMPTAGETQPNNEEPSLTEVIEQSYERANKALEEATRAIETSVQNENSDEIPVVESAQHMPATQEQQAEATVAETADDTQTSAN